jgi:hypothetical protein
LKKNKDKKQGGCKEGITSDTITMEGQVIYCSNVPALCAVIVLEDIDRINAEQWEVKKVE